MSEYIERGYPTCKDCFHWVACKKMLDAAGITVSEDYAPDANRCDGFVPAADVVEVKHGRWVDKQTGAYGQWQSWCSVCGKHSGIGGVESSRHKPYCPKCGAKMDGE